MDHKSTIRMFENFVLIVFSWIIYFSNAISFLPEMDDPVYNGLPLFNVVQYLLGMFILVLTVASRKLFLQGLREYAEAHFKEEFLEIGRRFHFLEKILDFFLWIVGYVLTVPDLQTILQKTGHYHRWSFMTANFLFILVLIFLLLRIWNAVQDAIAEHVRHKKSTPDLRDRDPG